MSISEDSESILACEDSSKPSAAFRLLCRPGEKNDSEHFYVKKAEIYMFAEDLVNYILKQFHNVSYPRMRLKKCRDLLHNAFNGAVKEAVHFIRWQITNPGCLPSLLTEEILCAMTEDYYRTLVDDIFTQYSEEGLNAGLLLYYCVYFAELASKLEFSEIAVYSILDAFAITTEGWKELNIIAGKIVRLSKDRSIYPEYKPERRDRSLLLKTDDADANVTIRCLEAYTSNPEKDSKYLSNVVENIKPGIYENVQTHYVSGKLERSKDVEVASPSANESCSENSKESSDPLNDSEIEDLQFLELEARLTVSHDVSECAKQFLCCENDDQVDTSSFLAKKGPKVSYDELKLQSQIKFLMTNLNDSSSMKDECINESSVIYEKVVPEQTVDTSVIYEKVVPEQTVDTSVNVEGSEVEDKGKSCLNIFVRHEPCWSAQTGDLIVQTADRLVFAEDIVGFISNEFYGIPYSKSRVKSYRPILFNAFNNETIKEAVRLLGAQVQRMKWVEHLVANLIDWDIRCYRRFIAGILSHYSKDGIRSGIFLYFCVYFTELALMSGFPVLDFAVFSILDAFYLLTDDFDDMNIIAEKIVRTSKYRTACQDYSPSRHDQSRISNSDDMDVDVLSPCFTAGTGKPDKPIPKTSTERQGPEEVAHKLSMKCDNTQRNDEEIKNEAVSSTENPDELVSPFPNESRSKKFDEISDSLCERKIEYLDELEFDAGAVIIHEAVQFLLKYKYCESDQKVCKSLDLLIKETTKIMKNIKFINIWKTPSVKVANVVKEQYEDGHIEPVGTF